MQLRTLKPFTLRSESGALLSPRKGTIFTTEDSEYADALIAAGLAEEYTLVEPKGTELIVRNGTYDVAGRAKATVNVPGPTGSISITENGEAIDVAAYATANVAVPNPSTGTLEISENGTYDVTAYASVTVAVPAPTTEGEGGES